MKKKIFLPYIEQSEQDLINKASLEDKINILLQNSYSTSSEYEYDKNNETIINKNTYYIIITEKKVSFISFIIFALISDNNERFNNELEKEIHNFNKHILK